MVLNGSQWGSDSKVVQLEGWKEGERMTDGFIGEYYHTIDAKGRVIIPQKFREELGDHFILSRGLDGCLWIQSQEEWNDFRGKLRQLSTIDKKSRNFKRFFTAGATPCELDKQGRILVPAALRKHAGLEKDVVLTGMDNRIELWSLDTWENVSDIDESGMDEIAQHLIELGVDI